MRKALVIVLFSLLLLLSFSSCSEDPRVAPTKVFIVSVDEDGRSIEYNPDYGLRMVNIRLGEEYIVDAVTNRVPTGAKLKWTSAAQDTVSVDENGVCKGLKYGDSLISVAVNNVKSTAVCLIRVVKDPDHIPDPEEGEPTLEVVRPEDLGGFIISDGNFCIIADNEEDLASKRLHLNWTHSNPEAAVLEYRWYIDGSTTPAPGLTTNDEYLTFNTFGYHNVTVEALVNIDGLEPYTSTISVIIRTLPSSLAGDSFVWGE